QVRAVIDSARERLSARRAPDGAEDARAMLREFQKETTMQAIARRLKGRPACRQVMRSRNNRPCGLMRSRNTRTRHLEKSTLGACAAPGDCSSKYARGPLPMIFAVRTCGKCRM